MKHTITLLDPLMMVLRDSGEVSIPSWTGGSYLTVGDACMVFIDGVPTKCVRTRGGLRRVNYPLVISISPSEQKVFLAEGAVRILGWDPSTIKVGQACAVCINDELIECVRTPEGLRLKDFEKKGPNMTLNDAIAVARTCLHAAQGHKITSEVDGEMLIDANMADAYDVLARWHSLLDGRGVMLLKSFRRDVAPTGTPVDLHNAVTTARGALAAGQGKAVPDGLAPPDMEAAYVTLMAWHLAVDCTGTQILRSFSRDHDLDDDDS